LAIVGNVTLPRPISDTLSHAATQRQHRPFSRRVRVYLCRCRQGVFILAPEQRYTRHYRTKQQRRQRLARARPLVIDTRIYRLRLPTQARPLVCACTSGDVAPPVQDSVDWPTATHTTAASLLSFASPPNRYSSSVVRSLRPHRRQRPHRSAYHRCRSRLRTAAPDARAVALALSPSCSL
jgi:hypothetical protein